MAEHAGDDIGGAAAPGPEINAITFRVLDMTASVVFYRHCGMEVIYGGPDASFTTLSFGANYVNLTTREGPPSGAWGRVIFHVESPDELWSHLRSCGYHPSTEPRDAPWGERYFAIRDPDGNDLSFARRLDGVRPSG